MSGMNGHMTAISAGGNPMCNVISMSREMTDFVRLMGFTAVAAAVGVIGIALLSLL